MATEIAVMLLVVVPDRDSAAAGVRDLLGRELPTVPGSWVSRVAVHDVAALRDRLSSAATPGTATVSGPPGPPAAGELEQDTAGDDAAGDDAAGEDDDLELEFETVTFDDPDDDPARTLH